MLTPVCSIPFVMLSIALTLVFTSNYWIITAFDGFLSVWTLICLVGFVFPRAAVFQAIRTVGVIMFICFVAADIILPTYVLMYNKEFVITHKKSTHHGFDNFPDMVSEFIYAEINLLIGTLVLMTQLLILHNALKPLIKTPETATLVEMEENCTLHNF